ncbi:hypothetical protein Acsp06_25170 [Actinomycetospora sp. NBRC 106375]|uniref:hypothetical protein n=1 Tax=Actinomycetospora sp. NBRC 106375 TaxID=3032207 RepID=UPI0024A1C292|nr:hypothetical protein [Actinomycetospora sp. NBRC 106375]GLZ46332.1 hypothetical protein Acsp06_25170 [Actinomycetospora sp. NBRC 106375]
MTAVSPRPAAGSSRPSEGPPELGAAIRAALDHLADLANPPEAVRDGRLDRMLRASLDAQLAATAPTARRVMEDVAAAVRTACAHLAATELEDAYLALRAAVDRLPRRPSA